jgi:hypothetical protein
LGSLRECLNEDSWASRKSPDESKEGSGVEKRMTIFWGLEGQVITKELINSPKQADSTSALRPQINYPNYDKKIFY